MDAIRRYYLQEVVNLHNRDSFDSKRLSSKIDSLRNLIKKRFLWDGEVAFFPNSYYAKRTVFENLRDRKMFTNNFDSFTMSGFEFEVVSCLYELNSCENSCVLWRGKIDEEKIGDNFFVFSEIDWDMECPIRADAFVTNPIDGVSILGFKGELKPFYLGSNSISFLDRETFEFSKEFSRFECGTGNYALLLFLEDYLNK